MKTASLLRPAHLAIALSLLTALPGRCFYNPVTGRWLSRDPIQEAAFASTHPNAPSPQAKGTPKSPSEGPLYTAHANQTISRIDPSGLENVSVVVTTVIRDPDPEPGVKTKHIVVVGHKGNLIYTAHFIGTTDLIIVAPSGTASFYESAGGDFPSVGVSMAATASSAALPSLLSIRYGFQVSLDFCTRKGFLSGAHEYYPSYTVVVKGHQIYDFQQGSISGLAGLGMVSPQVEFGF